MASVTELVSALERASEVISPIAALGRQPGASGAAGSPLASPGDSAPTGTADASAAPGASSGTGAGAAAKPSVARDELWVLVVLVVLVFLLVEWLVYHRDAVTRLWRGFRRGAPDAGPAGTARRGR